ncbi:sensor histidine kinase [Aquimarina litoralis]|uniref:sensor histidine kinase n=1 Tax=Aquimarina litoralis TaxID=584605 RepID=UPI001C596D2E|nr:histidine kinase [Aquimarina litoralis]MBW1297011.1 hypothetical protein [Aquimarina litoralis]
MEKQPPKLSLLWRCMIVFIIAAVMMGIIYIASKFKEPPGFNFFFEVLWMFIIFLCFETISRAQNYVSKRSDSNVILLIGGVVTGTITYTILFYLYKWLDHWVLHSEPPLLQHMVFSVLIGIAISVILGLIQLAYNWKNQYYISQIQNEKFKKEIIKANLSILKNQLDPHFMFNNFNTLYYLINEDSQLAQKFLKNIADVYRYILQHNEQAMIPIAQEYKMVKQYVSLIEQRYKSALQVHDTVDTSLFSEKSIPPLVLQQLIENAVKHNRIDDQAPLHIYFQADDTYFTVKNNHNPKQQVHTTGTGLDNITKRYDFLTDKEVLISRTDDEFSVSVPLIFSTNGSN